MVGAMITDKDINYMIADAGKTLTNVESSIEECTASTCIMYRQVVHRCLKQTTPEWGLES